MTRASAPALTGASPRATAMPGLAPGPALAAALALFLALAAGYRWFGAGRDYGDYLQFWNDLGPFETLGESRFEPGFVLTAWVFRELGADYGLFASSLILLSLSIKFALLYRHCAWPLAAIASYVGLFYFLHEYTQIRVAVALAFAFLATSALAAGKPIRAGIWLLAGALFQSSILVVGLGFVLYLALSSLRGALLMGMAALASGFLLARLSLLDLLTVANPLLLAYVENAADFDPPNPYGPGNLLVIATVLVSLPLAVEGRDRFFRLCLILAALAPIGFALLLPFPVVAVRLWAVFAFFVVPLAFRRLHPDLGALTMLFTLANAAWSVRNAAIIGLIGS